MMTTRLPSFLPFLPYVVSLTIDLCLLAMQPSLSQASDSTAVAPPTAVKKPHLLEIHGKQRVDNYYWMRDRDDPAVIEWLEAENSYRRKVMERTDQLQEKLVAELKERIKQDDQSAAYPDRGYDWFSRTVDGKQYDVHYRRKHGTSAAAPSSEEELVLDENLLAEGHEFCSVAGVEPSPSGQIVAWPVDFVGRRMYTIQFRDMESGRMLNVEIPDTTGNFVFAEDNLHLFYTRQDPDTLRSDRVFCHRIGTDPSTDRLIYTEQDEQFSVHVAPTKSRRFIQIVSSQTLSSEVQLLDAHNPQHAPVIFLQRLRNHEYSLDHLDDRFVIRTNWRAPNFCLMQADKPGSDLSQWRTLLPHDSSVFLENFELLSDWLVVDERTEGLTRIRYRRWEAGEFQTLDFGQPCYDAGLAATSVADTDMMRYSFSSPKTPPSIIDVDLRTGAKTIVKQQEVLGGFDSQDYVTERIWATAQDGVQVPVAILRHRSTPVDGTAPCLVYAYGSYGLNIEDGFNPLILNLVNRGFVYAVAHIRGGQEMGRYWYEDGKLLKKKNTFSDFIDCSRHLVQQEVADPARLYARGGSAGGLLMGAVTNIAPELFHGVIADVPFVDVVTTMLDESIPLTTSEYDEWGNPNEPQYYDYMLSYSPYDNVVPRAYPNMLITTGLHDSQVQYWEPAKWVAKLRELKTDNNLLLLRTEMNAGHGGSSGRYDRYRETAMRQAFLLMLAGIDR